jgi:hypothetical protein
MNRDLVIKRIAARCISHMPVAELQMTLMRYREAELEKYWDDESLEDISPDSLSVSATNLVVARQTQDATWDRWERLNVHLANGGVMADFK